MGDRRVMTTPPPPFLSDMRFLSIIILLEVICMVFLLRGNT